jgi:hypothetical protein
MGRSGKGEGEGMHADALGRATGKHHRTLATLSKMEHGGWNDPLPGVGGIDFAGWL